MQDFLNAVKENKTLVLEQELLEEITEKHPYFHLAKSILLKKYHHLEHFKYNIALKNIAAHTVDRNILFEYINTIENKKSIKPKPTTVQNFISKNTENTSEIGKPFVFDNSEKHSFHQWLQLTNTEPVVRLENNSPKKTTKLSIIDKFIENNPKISPVKKTASQPIKIKNNNGNISEELMTETLAKVYFAQKKYEKAIKAYKILSLKYPEKSSFFANQIKAVEQLQEQNNKE